VRLDARRRQAVRTLAVLLAAAHVSAGCFFQPSGKPYWQAIKGSARKEPVQLENVVETSRVYEIPASKVSFDGETVSLLAYATATRSEFTIHRTDALKTERQMANYVHHKIPWGDDPDVDATLITMGIVMPLICIAIAESGKGLDGEPLEGGDYFLLILFGGLTGFLDVMMILDAILPPKKTKATGEERTTLVKSEETRTLADRKMSRNPAAGVRVRASSSSVLFVISPGDSSARADAKTAGIGRAAFAVTAPRSIIGTSKDDVCARTVGATELRYLTEKPRVPLLSEVKKATSAFPIRLQLETLDPGVTATHVKNARVQVTVDAWAVRTDSVRQMLDRDVRAYVSRINSTVREVRVTLKDGMTRVPVRGAKVSGEPDSEGPGVLAARYATGPVAKGIVAGVRPDQHGRKALVAKGPSFTFSARVPCELLIRVEHPGYAPADLSTRLDRRRLRKTVFLTRAGRGEARVADE